MPMKVNVNSSIGAPDADVSVLSDSTGTFAERER
jgi:hypothetical protein